MLKNITKIGRNIVFGLMLTTPAFAADAQLPAGPWNAVANGFHGQLQVDNVTPTGFCSGTFLGDPIVGCLFDSVSGKLTFLRVPAGRDQQSIQVYTGFVWSEGTGDVTYHVAGSFTAYPGSGGTATRNQFGWSAELLIPG